jgi:hypothetical protein
MMLVVARVDRSRGPPSAEDEPDHILTQVKIQDGGDREGV